MNNFKKRWGISSNFQVIVILIVFAITGSSSVFVGNYVLQFLNITVNNYSVIIFYILKIIIVSVVYQFLLLTFGFIFGQIKFFWNFEKKMLTSLGNLFKKK